jgi:60 kDa SS-A/Ro ribonucleoprotein
MVRFVGGASTRRGIEKTENRAGGVAFVMTPEKKLLNMAATCMFGETKYYGSVEKDIQETIGEISKKDPKFPLQVAAYIRSELHLRTTPIAMLTMAANEVNCKPYVRLYTPKIIQRADELNETIAAQLKLFGKPIPNSLKKGINDAFKKFNEYHISKYNREGSVKFKDVIMLTHAKEPSELIGKIMSDSLETPKTWEVEISTKGASRENWENILPSMNYMAVIRNINNFCKHGIPTEKYLPTISNKELVLKSKQLPFRFYSAMQALDVSDPFVKKEIESHLEKALIHSIENLPRMKGRTVIAVDLSHSMKSKLSEKSVVTHKQISALFGAMSNTFCDNAILYGFAQKLADIKMTGNILQDTNTIINTFVGTQTNGHLVINDLIRNNIKTDRIIFYTDEELWNSEDCSCNFNSSVMKYMELFPECQLYIINVNGYGDTCISRHAKNAMTIHGFSESILKFIEAEESDQINYIKDNY